MISALLNPNQGNASSSGDLSSGIQKLADGKLQRMHRKQEFENNLLSSLLGGQEPSPTSQQMPAENSPEEMPAFEGEAAEKFIADLLEKVMEPQEQSKESAPEKKPDKKSAAKELKKQETIAKKEDATQKKIDAQRAKMDEKIALEREKASLKREGEEYKENVKRENAYYKDILKQQLGAEENDKRLDRMLTLIDKGNLPNANLWTFLSKIEEQGVLSSAGAFGGSGAGIGGAIGGIPGAAIGGALGGIVGALSGPLAGAIKSNIKTGSPDIIEFEKLSEDFVKGAKAYFSGRVTDYDLKSYMKTVPTLMQTDAGKKAVMSNLKSFNELAKLEGKTARDIVKKNGGKVPIDLNQQVSDQLSDEKDRLAAIFKNPEGEAAGEQKPFDPVAAILPDLG